MCNSLIRTIAPLCIIAGMAACETNRSSSFAPVESGGAASAGTATQETDSTIETADLKASQTQSAPVDASASKVAGIRTIVDAFFAIHEGVRQAGSDDPLTDAQKEEFHTMADEIAENGFGAALTEEQFIPTSQTNTFVYKVSEEGLCADQTEDNPACDPLTGRLQVQHFAASDDAGSFEIIMQVPDDQGIESAFSILKVDYDSAAKQVTFHLDFLDLARAITGLEQVIDDPDIVSGLQEMKKLELAGNFSFFVDFLRPDKHFGSLIINESVLLDARDTDAGFRLAIEAAPKSVGVSYEPLAGRYEVNFDAKRFELHVPEDDGGSFAADLPKIVGSLSGYTSQDRRLFRDVSIGTVENPARFYADGDQTHSAGFIGTASFDLWTLEDESVTFEYLKLSEVYFEAQNGDTSKISMASATQVHAASGGVQEVKNGLVTVLSEDDETVSFEKGKCFQYHGAGPFQAKEAECPID